MRGERNSSFGPSQRLVEAGGSLILETQERVASSPDNDGTGKPSNVSVEDLETGEGQQAVDADVSSVDREGADAS